MIEKNKTYTYEEIEGILLEAKERISKELKEKATDNNKNPMGALLMEMNNEIIMTLLIGEVLHGDKHE